MKHIFKSPPNTKFGSVVKGLSLVPLLKVEHVIDRYGIYNGNETNTRGFFILKKELFVFLLFLFVSYLV